MKEKDHAKTAMYSAAALFCLIQGFFPADSYLYCFRLVTVVIGALAGTLTPDFDRRGSTALSYYIAGKGDTYRAIEHRCELHTPFSALRMCIVPVVLWAVLQQVTFPDWKISPVLELLAGLLIYYTGGFLWGYLLHLFENTASPTGICWLYPFVKCSYSFPTFRLTYSSRLYQFLVCMISILVMFAGITLYALSAL